MVRNMTARTESQLSDYFDEDLSWRRKELSDLKSAIRSADEHSRSVLLRSLITMVYAHWEGYVKNCANAYFDFITLTRRPFSDVDRQFYVNRFLPRLHALHQSRASIKSGCDLIAEILDGQTTRFSHINPNLVDTGSNLKTDVIKDICLICGVDGTHFEDKRAFIDVIVLKRRNSIAHGNYESVDEHGVDALVADILALMNHFRTLLENKIYTKGYLAA